MLVFGRYFVGIEITNVLENTKKKGFVESDTCFHVIPPAVKGFDFPYTSDALIRTEMFDDTLREDDNQVPIRSDDITDSGCNRTQYGSCTLPDHYMIRPS